MKILTNNDIKALFLDYTFENGGGNKCPTLSSVRARLLNVNYINITANHNETNRLITSISATKQQDTPDVPEETVFTGEWITTDIGIGLDGDLIFWQSELDKTNTVEFEGCDYLAPARDDVYSYVEDHGVLIGRRSGSTSNIKKSIVPHIDLDSLTFTINGDAVSVSIDGLNLTNLVAYPVGLRPGVSVSSLKFIATGQVSVLNSAQEVVDTTTLEITAVINTLDLPDDCKIGGPDDYYDFNNEGITLRGRLYIDGGVVLNDKVYTISTNEITNFSC